METNWFVDKLIGDQWRPLQGVVRTSKNSVLKKYFFSDFKILQSLDWTSADVLSVSTPWCCQAVVASLSSDGSEGLRRFMWFKLNRFVRMLNPWQQSVDAVFFSGNVIKENHVLSWSGDQVTHVRFFITLSPPLWANILRAGRRPHFRAGL